jgi:hypothetical protein
MAITVAQLPGYLRKIADDLQEHAPVAAADAMGSAYIRVVVSSMKGDSPSPPGTPPARVTGTLARSIRKMGGYRSGTYSYTIPVAPHTVYARIQQLGGDIYPKHDVGAGREGEGTAWGEIDYGPKGAGWKGYYVPRPYKPTGGRLGYLRWSGKGGVHYSQHVYLPKRPYMVMSEQARTECHDAAAQALQDMLKVAE